MNKCVDCAYFLNCEKANEQKVCEKYRYVRKNIEIKEEIANMIKEKSIEMQIADLFYKMCPNVPPQLLASTVIETMNNFRELNKLYSRKVSIKIADKEIGKLNIPSVIKEQKMLDDNYLHIPKID